MTKKELFQAAALKLIYEKGFKAMTMRELATEMSCDIKNLYNYTSSKDALLVELLEDISENFHLGMSHIVDANLTPTQQLKELIRLHVMLSYEKPKRVGLLINEYRNLKEPHYSSFLTRRDEYEDQVSTIIKRGIEQSEFRSLNVQIATQSILGGLRWQYDLYHQNDEQLNPYDVMKELIQLILPGIIAID